MIEELIIKGNFEVEGLPKGIKKKLTFLKLKTGINYQGVIRVEEFH